MKQYIVGGAIRDCILNRVEGWSFVVNDVDYVVTDCTHQEMIDMYGDSIGAGFPVWIDDQGNEVALARVERSIGEKSTDFTFKTDGVTIEDDLSRRDLTINSMAVAIEHSRDMFVFGPDIDKIIDPYNGMSDIQNKILRHTTIAFKEDPLRVLRLARFYAKLAHNGFTIAPDTIALCKEMVSSGMLKTLPCDRIWKETIKALKERNSHLYFKFLGEVGFCAQPTSREINDLIYYNRVSLSQCDTETYENMTIMSKWVSFNCLDRFSAVFRASKKYRIASSAYKRLCDADAFDATIVETLKIIGAYSDNECFETALSQLKDTVKVSLIEHILQETRGITLDMPQGKEYGIELNNTRIKIAHKIISGSMPK